MFLKPNSIFPKKQFQNPSDFQILSLQVCYVSVNVALCSFNVMVVCGIYTKYVQKLWQKVQINQVLEP